MQLFQRQCFQRLRKFQHLSTPALIMTYVGRWGKGTEQPSRLLNPILTRLQPLSCGESSCQVQPVSYLQSSLKAILTLCRGFSESGPCLLFQIQVSLSQPHMLDGLACQFLGGIYKFYCISHLNPIYPYCYFVHRKASPICLASGNSQLFKSLYFM